MKIFLSFLQGKPGHPIPAYSFWEYYIKNGIEEAGHTWTEIPEVDWAYGLVTQSQESLHRWKEEVWSKTLYFLQNNKVDLFLSYLYPQQIDVNAITEIKKLGIPVVNFFCDNVREFKKTPKEYTVFDLNWVPEYAALEMYKTSGAKSIHLPMPMWVDPSIRTISKNESSQVSFIGSYDIQRHLLFEQILSKNPDFDLNIYGAAWLKDDADKTPSQILTLKQKLHNQLTFLRKHGICAWNRKNQQRNFTIQFSDRLKQSVKGKPSFNNYVAITQSSCITLGINRYPSYHFPLNQPDTYSRLRDIEAPMLGACYLTEWTKGLDEMYTIGSEIETYRTSEELAYKAAFLLKHKSQRDKMRYLGQQKALTQHSIPAALKKIRNKLGI